MFASNGEETHGAAEAQIHSRQENRFPNQCAEIAEISCTLGEEVGQIACCRPESRLKRKQ